MRKCLLTVLITVSSIIYSQNTGTFSGQVIDEKTQNPLEGSTVLLEGTNIGVITDVNGYFMFENIPTQS